MLPLIFACILAFIVLMYVILDGFDLGIGILFPFTHSETERDIMMNSVAPIWDGNETWLVFGGAMLYGAFPMAYGMLLPILYSPIMLMVIALIFRGVSFEFRFKAEKSKFLWNWIFCLSSIAAAFFQGIILGCFIEGFSIDQTQATISHPDWLTPFTLLTGLALVCGYSLLGSTWMLMKCKAELQTKMRQYAKDSLVLVGIFLFFVSIWTPLHSKEIFDRWFSFPNIILLSPLPLLALTFILLEWKSLIDKDIHKPFFYSIGIFICAYIGIAISVYPYLIPYKVTFWEASSPNSTLIFILIGVAIMLPILLGYTAYAYYIFHDKNHEMYHL